MVLLNGPVRLESWPLFRHVGWVPGRCSARCSHSRAHRRRCPETIRDRFRIAEAVAPDTRPTHRSVMPTPPVHQSASPPSSALPAGELRVLGLFNRITGISPDVWPQRLVVRAWFSDITLDLRSAALPPVSTIDLSAWLSEVTIVVPPDVHVEFDCYTMIAQATDESRVFPMAAKPDAPRVRIVGTAHVAEVRVRVRPR